MRATFPTEPPHLSCLTALNFCSHTHRPSDLFLVVFDGELESTEVHALLQQAPFVNVILAGCVVQNHFQLPRVSGLRQQVLSKHLTLLCQLLVVVPKVREIKEIKKLDLKIVNNIVLRCT